MEWKSLPSRTCEKKHVQWNEMIGGQLKWLFHPQVSRWTRLKTFFCCWITREEEKKIKPHSLWPSVCSHLDGMEKRWFWSPGWSVGWRGAVPNLNDYWQARLSLRRGKSGRLWGERKGEGERRRGKAGNEPPGSFAKFSSGQRRHVKTEALTSCPFLKCDKLPCKTLCKLVHTTFGFIFVQLWLVTPKFNIRYLHIGVWQKVTLWE